MSDVGCYSSLDLLGHGILVDPFRMSHYLHLSLYMGPCVLPGPFPLSQSKQMEIAVTRIQYFGLALGGVLSC